MGQERGPGSPRILIVDDEDSILFAMKDYLDRDGFRVDAARGVAEAKLLLCRKSYGAVVSDLNLDPRYPAQGLELLEHVRSSQPGTRTVLLTAYGSPEMEKRARALGIDAVLDKSEELRAISGVLGTLTGEAGTS
jgi:DNA-binding NtrC family response regulator